MTSSTNLFTTKLFILLIIKFQDTYYQQHFQKFYSESLMKLKNYQYILVFDLFYYLLYVKVEKYAYLRFFNELEIIKF